MWPFRRRRNLEPSPEAVQAQADARTAHREASAAFRREAARRPEVDRVARSLREAQLRNHFSEAMEKLIVKGSQ